MTHSECDKKTVDDTKPPHIDIPTTTTDAAMTGAVYLYKLIFRILYLYFYLYLGTRSIISTPNQLFSTSDLEIFTNRPRDNLANLYPTSHGPFLPNFLQITPKQPLVASVGNSFQQQISLIIYHIN